MNKLAILSKAMISERKDILLSILGDLLPAQPGWLSFSERVSDFTNGLYAAALHLDYTYLNGQAAWPAPGGKPLRGTPLFA